MALFKAARYQLCSQYNHSLLKYNNNVDNKIL